MAADDGAQSLNYTAVLARTPLAQSQRLFTIESVSDLTDDMGAASLGATGQPEAPSKPALTLPLGSMPRLYELTSETPTAEQDAMLDPGWNGVHPSRFEVRGPTYLHDKKKISGPALFTTAGVDVFRSTKCEEDFAIRPAYAAYQILEAMPATELFILNIQLPGPPFTGLLQVCSKPLVSPEMARVMEGPEGVAERLWHAFRDGTDEFRSKRLKLIANPIKAPFAIRVAIPNRPAVLGARVPLRWHRRERSLEVVLDVAFSAVAGPVWRMMRGVTRKIVLDLALIIEGSTADELPERVLAAMQWHRPDINKAVDCPPAADLGAAAENEQSKQAGGRGRRRASQRNSQARRSTPTRASITNRIRRLTNQVISPPSLPPASSAPPIVEAPRPAEHVVQVVSFAEAPNAAAAESPPSTPVRSPGTPTYAPNAPTPTRLSSFKKSFRIGGKSPGRSEAGSAKKGKLTVDSTPATPGANLASTTDLSDFSTGDGYRPSLLDRQVPALRMGSLNGELDAPTAALRPLLIIGEPIRAHGHAMPIDVILGEASLEPPEPNLFATELKIAYESGSSESTTALLSSAHWQNASAHSYDGLVTRLQMVVENGMPPMRVISAARLEKLGEIPRSNFGHAEDALAAVKSCGGGKDGRPKAVLVMFSHRWLRPLDDAQHRAHPDSASGAKANALVQWSKWFKWWRLYGDGRNTVKGITTDPNLQIYFWVDFSCVEQDSSGPAMAALPAYVAACSEMLVFETADYESRAWCQIEVMMAHAFMGDGEKVFFHQVPPGFMHRRQRKVELKRTAQSNPNPLHGELTREVDRKVILELRECASKALSWRRFCKNLSSGNGCSTAAMLLRSAACLRLLYLPCYRYRLTPLCTESEKGVQLEAALELKAFAVAGLGARKMPPPPARNISPSASHVSRRALLMV